MASSSSSATSPTRSSSSGSAQGKVDVGKTEIEQFGPDLLNYISHLHIAVSGFIAAAGIAVAALAWYGVRRGEWWAWVTAVDALKTNSHGRHVTFSRPGQDIRVKSNDPDESG